ncbi:MAG TPA: hypothetical protein VLM89_00710 [Phycisphaerae bacterium]|nr:hypothetical protein [Phycisphaerae bacterium]
MPARLVRHLYGILASAALCSVTLAADPELVKRWEFVSPDSSAGWSALHDLRDFRVADGKLQMEIAGTDAYFTAPPVDTSLDGLVVRLHMRADRPGETQVYWATADAPHYNAGAMATRFVPASPADREPMPLDFPIGTPADAGRKLVGLRIDPCNRNSSGHVEFTSVELLRMPTTYDAHFSADACRADPDQPVSFHATCRRLTGRGSNEPIEFTIADTPPRSVAADADGTPAHVQDMRFDQPGLHRIRALIRPPSPPAYDLETCVVVGGVTTLPTIKGLRTDRLRLDLVPTLDTRRVGAARWQIAGDDRRFHQAGWLMPLADITFRQPDGRIVRRQPAFEIIENTPQLVRLAGRVEENPDWKAEVAFRACPKTPEIDRLEAGPTRVLGQALSAVSRDEIPFIETIATLTGPDGGELLDFSGPVLRADRDDASADPLDRHAIFGGLEFLDPGWPSSSDRAVGPKFSDRWTPHPFKICLPAMIVEAAGLTTALFWQPLDAWDGKHAMPAATFASPNFLDSQPNHLMKLSVPSIPDWRNENESVARTPCITEPGRPLTIRYALVGQSDTPAALAGRAWYQVFGLPRPPTPVRGDSATYDLYARHLGDTMYWPADKGWRHHWFLDKSSRFSGWMAAELLAHAAVTGHQQWIERTNLAGRSIIDTAGTLADQVANAAPTDAAIRAMRPDGTWTYANTPELREKVRESTGGRFDSLGEDGTTSLGTCAINAVPILRHALLTGQEKYIQASTRALRAMRQFRVPRGAQVWEVHKDIPDIRAAALAVEAFHLGYQVIGDRAYLDDAACWAWAGVPFLYSWRLPLDDIPGGLTASRDRDAPYAKTEYFPLSDGFENPSRQVTPFGSIPVLGPTMYVINWFGVIVQWCGLEWAAHVIDLDRDRPDPLLRAIADGVVASGLQQTFDRPPWVGLYPDVWDTPTNIAQGAFICARLPMECLRAQGRLPRWASTWTCIIRDPAGPARRHISGWGPQPELSWPTAGNPLTLPLEYLPGEPNELIIAGSDKPRLVRINDQVLDPAPDAAGSSEPPGWRYDRAPRMLIIRFIQPARYATVRIEW